MPVSINPGNRTSSITGSISPERIIHYIGLAKTERGLEVLKTVFDEAGITLLLESQQTITEEDRLEKGIIVQKSIFGPMIDAMRANSHAIGNLMVGNNADTLIAAVTQCMPYIGFPRTLNAITAITQAVQTLEQMKVQNTRK